MRKHVMDFWPSSTMNISLKNRYFLLSSLCVLGSAPHLNAFQQEVLRREVSRSSEKEVMVSLDASFGTLNILRGTSNKIAAAEYRRENDDKRQLEMFYDIEDGRGNLEINLTDEKRRREHRSSSVSWEELKGDHKDADERQLTVKFTDLSTGNPTFYSYDFGDGINMTGPNPVHTYRQPGNYTVSLTVMKNDPGNGTMVSNSSVRKNFIIVHSK